MIGTFTRRPSIRSVAAAALLAAAGSISPLPTAAQEEPVLVSTDWLAEHSADPDLVLLHVGMAMRGMPEEFISGARFIDYHGFTADANGLVAELTPVDQMVEALQAAGVSNDSRVILYGTGSAHIPARIFMALDYLGMGERTSVLDGGLETWKAQNRPTSTEATEASRGAFHANLQNDVLVTAAWIAERLDDSSVTLIDARPESEYSGQRDQQGLRPGHIPGAYNLFWSDLMLSDDQPVLRALDEVKARWAEAGADPDGVVVNYCFIGMRASYTYLISKHLGFDARFYDGSWNEWGADDALPAVAGSSRR